MHVEIRPIGSITRCEWDPRADDGRFKTLAPLMCAGRRV